jgi:hypothetical protein
LSHRAFKPWRGARLAKLQEAEGASGRKLAGAFSDGKMLS